SSCIGVRRDGAAALDLAYVAAGRLDGFWEMDLAPWDTSAGVVLVTEAGGMVSDMGGGTFDPFRGEVVATNGRMHGELLALLERPEG
ncbi:MAG: inositol monophosphatase, partial [Thermoplasmata archaeon]|nr:inositol monophosphatase [Thermoplasmata archaeon]